MPTRSEISPKFSLRYGFLLGNSIYVVGYREFEVGNMIT